MAPAKALSESVWSNNSSEDLVHPELVVCLFSSLTFFCYSPCRNLGSRSRTTIFTIQIYAICKVVPKFIGYQLAQASACCFWGAKSHFFSRPGAVHLMIRPGSKPKRPRGTGPTSWRFEVEILGNWKHLKPKVRHLKLGRRSRKMVETSDFKGRSFDFQWYRGACDISVSLV